MRLNRNELRKIQYDFNSFSTVYYKRIIKIIRMY